MAWISGPVTGKQGEVPNSLMRKLLEKLKNTGKIPEFEGQPSIDEIMELATTGKEPPSVKRDYGLRDWEKDFIPAPPPEEATGVDVRDPDAWLEDMMEMLTPEYIEELEDIYGPEVLTAFAESLERPFEKAKAGLTSSLVARGISKSGHAREQRAELAAQKQGMIDVKSGELGQNMMNYLLGQGEGIYERLTALIQDELMSETGKEEQDAAEFFAENQEKINALIEEIASQEEYDFTGYISDFEQDTQGAFDTYSAIGNLFSSGGRLASQFSAPSSGYYNMPMSQALSPKYDSGGWHDTMQYGGQSGQYGGQSGQYRGSTI